MFRDPYDAQPAWDEADRLRRELARVRDENDIRRREHLDACKTIDRLGEQLRVAREECEQLRASVLTLQGQVTRARDENTSLRAAREECRWHQANAKMMAAVADRHKASEIRLEGELKRLRAALEETDENLRVVGDIVSERMACGHCDGTCVACTSDAILILAAIRRRAGLEGDRG